MRRALGRLAAAGAIAAAVAAPVWAAEPRFEGSFTQGGLVEGHAAPGATVRIDGHPVRVSPEGLFLIGFGRDAKGPVTVEIRDPDGAVSRRRFAVARRVYRLQRIDGLPAAMVTPSPEALARIEREAQEIAVARARDTAETLFTSGFTWPVRGRISGVFGSQRILNGKPRQPHTGVDIAAPEGTPVVAPAAGIVVLAEPDLYFTGGTVILDHGYGLSSVFAHMSALEVRLGQRLRKGERLGRVGATGRATGPHLHWGVNLFATRLDPALIAGPMAKSP